MGTAGGSTADSFDSFDFFFFSGEETVVVGSLKDGSGDAFGSFCFLGLGSSIRSNESG